MDRKEFLGLVGRSALLAAAAPVLPLSAAPREAGRAFTARQRLALRAAADTLIPAGDGMPAAGELGAVGVLDPLARRDAAVAGPLREALASLERLARARHRRRFERLPAADKVAVLQALETDDPDRFRALRDLVYEAYYTHPEVWRRLGYEFITGEEAGRALEPFEEELLARVRALAPLHREAR